MNYCISFSILSKAEEQRLKDSIIDKRTENIVRDKLMKHNLRMVLSIALKYYNKFGCNVTIMDIVQAGMYGISKASKSYKMDSSATFSTYAYKYIMGEVLKEIRRIANHTHKEIKITIKHVEIDSLNDSNYSDSERYDDNINDMIKVIESNDKIKKLYESINILTGVNKKTIKLYAKGWTVRDIAKKHKVSNTTVWSRIYSSIDQLKEIIDPPIGSVVGL